MNSYLDFKSSYKEGDFTLDEKESKRMSLLIDLKLNINEQFSDINYYTFDRNEIDFVIQINNKIIPIEVKSDKSTNHNSLTKYNAKNDNEISFRFSLNNLSKDGKIINIPLYFIEYINELNLD